MPRFIIRRPGEAARVFELSGDRPVSIGRAKSSTVVLDHDSVSRQHALVRMTPDGQWQLIEREALNGVQVNGKPVKEVVLRPYDEIRLGDYLLRFEEQDVRGVLKHDTSQLPKRIVEELSRSSSYSGSSEGVVPFDSVVAPTRGESGPVLAQRVDSLEKENRLLTVLYRVNRSLGELATVEGIALRVLDLVLEIEGAERGYSMLLQESLMGQSDFRGGYEFQPAIIKYRRKSVGEEKQGPTNLTMSQSIVREVMRGGLPLLITDAQSDPRVSASKSVVLAGIRSALCAPFGTRERRFGLLYVDNLSQRGMFSIDQLNVFAVIAAQAGLAMDRVRTTAQVS